MQINPMIVMSKGIIKKVTDEHIQQVGIDLSIAKTIQILPKSFANVAVEQEFNMQDCFGIVTQRSSYSRKGIFVTSGVYDTGFIGQGGFTIYNMTNDLIQLDAGTRVAQMIVYEANPASKYDGHYNDSESIDSKPEEQK